MLKSFIIASLMTIILIDHVEAFATCDSLVKLGVFIGFVIPLFAGIDWLEEKIRKMKWRKRHESD